MLLKSSPLGKTTYHIKGPVWEKHLHVLSSVDQGWLCGSTGCLSLTVHEFNHGAGWLRLCVGLVVCPSCSGRVEHCSSHCREKGSNFIHYLALYHFPGEEPTLMHFTSPK